MAKSLTGRAATTRTVAKFATWSFELLTGATRKTGQSVGRSAKN
jgi:hypothetical protein